MCSHKPALKMITIIIPSWLVYLALGLWVLLEVLSWYNEYLKRQIEELDQEVKSNAPVSGFQKRLQEALAEQKLKPALKRNIQHVASYCAFSYL
jgi:hypothetical protein